MNPVLDRATLFHGSMAVYGAVVGGDTALAARAGALSLTAGASLAASALVLGYGLYGLANPEATTDRADSWLAYLVAAAAVLVVLSVATSRL